MSNFPFARLNLANTTPFDASSRIDWIVAGLVERYLAAGIKGFVLSFGTGMRVYLTKENPRTCTAGQQHDPIFKDPSLKAPHQPRPASLAQSRGSTH